MFITDWNVCELGKSERKHYRKKEIKIWFPNNQNCWLHLQTNEINSVNFIDYQWKHAITTSWFQAQIMGITTRLRGANDDERPAEPHMEAWIPPAKVQRHAREVMEAITPYASRSFPLVWVFLLGHHGGRFPTNRIEKYPGNEQLAYVSSQGMAAHEYLRWTGYNRTFLWPLRRQ